MKGARPRINYAILIKSSMLEAGFLQYMHLCCFQHALWMMRSDLHKHTSHSFNTRWAKLLYGAPKEHTQNGSGGGGGGGGGGRGRGCQAAQYLLLGTLYCLAMFCLWFSSTCLNLVSSPRSWTSIFSTYCRSLWVRWSSTWMDWVMFWTWGGGQIC